MAFRFLNRIFGARHQPIRAKGVYVYHPPQFDLPLRNSPRILILKLDHIGDLVLGMRAFREIRNAWPDAEITLVCSPVNMPLAQQLGLFDKILSCQFFEDRSHIERQPDAILADRFRKLQLPHFDLAIDLRFGDDTRFLLDHVDAQYTAGFFTTRIARPLDIIVPLLEVPPQATSRQPRNLSDDTRLLILARTVIDAFRRDEHPLRSLTSTETGAFPASPYAVISPASGAEIKQWPNEYFAAVGRALIDSGLAVVLVGDDTMEASCSEIAQHIGSKNVRDLSGILPLKDLPNLLNHAKLFVGNDSAPGHIAAALGIPTIVIFSGIANIDVWHPRGVNAIALKADIACSPCYRSMIADCPNARRCLTDITPDRVIAEAMKLCSRSVRHGVISMRAPEAN
jgi:ADP-heptose:LPS heptosyltransferase